MLRFLKYMNEACKIPQKPKWHSRNDIVYITTPYRLRCFRRNGKGLPIVILPPAAGHEGCICDYASNQSLIEVCLKNSKASIYVVEHICTTRERRNEEYDALIEGVDKCIKYVGNKAHVTGLCQGGTVAIIYAALFPEKVASLSIAATPVNFRVGKNAIWEMVDTLPMDFFRAWINLQGGLQMGINQILAFSALDTQRHYVQPFFDLYSNMDNSAFMEKRDRWRSWWWSSSDLSGKYYLRTIEELFKKDKLYHGDFFVCGEYVNLGKIICKVNLIAGERDTISPPEQTLNARKKLINAQSVVEYLIKDAGHISVFINTQALNSVWVKVIKNLDK